MTHRYLNFDQYNGSLGGLQEYPAGPYDVASPGGMSSMYHHPTQGFYGRPERNYDVYAGTGERYISGEYGNLYEPNSHASINDYYGGPQTAQTDNQTLSGDPYYWNNSSQNPQVVQSNYNLRPNSNNKPDNQKKNLQNTIPNSGKIIEGYEPIDGSFELIPTEIPQTKSIKSAPTVALIPNPISTPPLLDPSEFPSEGITTNTVLLLVIVLIVFIVCSFWWENLKKFLHKMHKGNGISSNRLLIYAIIMTMFLFLVLYISGVNLRV